MLNMVPKPPITAAQKRAALAVAATVDLLQVVVFPALLPGYVLDDALDVIAAVTLTAICGFKWQFALAFGMELVPFADLLPTWTAVVLLLGSSSSTVQASSSGPAPNPYNPPAPPRGPHCGVVDVQAIPLRPVVPPPLPHTR